jgi:hypothetical protein
MTIYGVKIFFVVKELMVPGYNQLISLNTTLPNILHDKNGTTCLTVSNGLEVYMTKLSNITITYKACDGLSSAVFVQNRKVCILENHLVYL